MIQLQRIKTPNSKQANLLFELYENSFPAIERRELPKLKKLIETNEEMFFCAIIQEEELCGLLCYWLFEKFIYLEHFAIFPEKRNRHIGEQVLTLLKEQFEYPLLFEVEPDTGEIQHRRICFYERNGFSILTKNYQQPSYSKNNETYPLWIMGNKEFEELEEFINEIKKQVYINHY